MRNNLVYKRIRTATEANDTQSTRVMMVKVFRLGGLSKFGVTPAGGVPAGPFNSIWTASGVEAIEGDAMMVCYRKIEWNCARSRLTAESLERLRLRLREVCVTVTDSRDRSALQWKSEV